MATKTTTPMLRLMAMLALALAIIGAPLATRAWAVESVKSYVVAGSVHPDGKLDVRAVITFDGAAPATLEQRFATTLDTVDNKQYTFDVVDVKATSAGKDLAPKVTQDGAFKVVSIPTQGLTAPVELSYSVLGAAIKEPTGDTTVKWKLLQGLNLAVRTFDAKVSIPSVLKLVDCQAGPVAAPGPCGYYGGGTHDNPDPIFHDEGRAPGEIVEMTLRFQPQGVQPNQKVRDLWTLQRAFSVAPLPLGLAVAAALLGGLAFWLLHRRFGRDALAAAEPTRIAEFHPVGDGHSEFRVLDEVRPGQVGTVVDERVDPIDVTATILDLAVRGHIRITELPQESSHKSTEWTFERRNDGDELAAYEKTLLDAVAPESGEKVHASRLAEVVGPVIGHVQSDLYDDVVQRGWFVRRPDTTRNSWATAAGVGLVVAFVIAALLVAMTEFGLLGLVLIGLALGAMFVGQEMPARTTEGASLLNGLQLLHAQLMSQPTNQMPPGREYEELSELLPYSVVLGGHDRWLEALVAADDDEEADSTDLDWYHAPEGWHMRDLPDSMHNFITTVQGTLFSR